MQLVKIQTADLNDLKALTISALVDSLRPILAGSVEDLQSFAKDIVEGSISAAAAGDQELLAQLADQRRALIEAGRVRFANGLGDTADRVIDAVLNYGIRLAANVVLPGVGAVLPI